MTREEKRFVGGQELAGWYWSSTEYSATTAWYLYLCDGIARNRTKATITSRVRPVSVFFIHKKTMEQNNIINIPEGYEID